MSKMQELSSKDRMILLALDAEPTASNVELARATGISRNTIQTRLQRLEKQEQLGAPSQRIRLPALGYPVLAFVTIELVQGAPRSIADSLRRIPELIDVHAVSGDGDLFARVAARDTADLFRVTQSLLRVPGIVRTRSMIAIHEIVPTRLAPLLRASTEPRASQD